MHCIRPTQFEKLTTDLIYFVYLNIAGFEISPWICPPFLPSASPFTNHLRKSNKRKRSDIEEEVSVAVASTLSSNNHDFENLSKSPYQSPAIRNKRNQNEDEEEVEAILSNKDEYGNLSESALQETKLLKPLTKSLISMQEERSSKISP